MLIYSAFTKVNMKLHRIIIFPLFCGYNTWSFTLREVNGLKVFKKRAMRNVFGPERQDVTGGLRKLLHEKIYDFFLAKY